MTAINSQKIELAKIVASPSDTSWAQAYNAGKLYAIISLTTEKGQEEQPLSAIGKECITILESEFFSLEEKNLATLESVAKTVLEKIPADITTHIILATLIDSILYIVTTKNGKVFVKRGPGFGVVTQEYSTTSPFTSFSGYIQDNDKIVLATQNFFDVVPPSTVAKTLESDNPSQVAETLMPPVHEKEDGSTAALILFYREQKSTFAENEEEAVVEPVIQQTEEKNAEEPLPVVPEKIKRSFSAFKNIRGRKFPVRLPLKGGKLLFLVVAAILVLILVFNAARTIKNRQTSADDALFSQVYPQAQKDYDQGQSLADLNAGLSHDSFAQAQTLLNQNINKFPQGSQDRQKMDALLQKVNAALSGQSSGTSVNATELSLDQNPLLKQLHDQSALFATENDTNVFLLLSTGISSFDKSTLKTKHIIDKSWTTPAGIGLYGSNLYVVDTKGTINKYVPTGDAYTKSNYFGGTTTPDLSKAVDLAIDGSLWVLNNDGTIMKFTRGSQDTFTLSNLPSPLKNPVRIFTNDGSDNLYVLDPSNQRIITLDKTGAFKQSYQSDVLKNASALTVSEKDKKMFVLTTNGKLYEINIK